MVPDVPPYVAGKPSVHFFWDKLVKTSGISTIIRRYVDSLSTGKLEGGQGEQAGTAPDEETACGDRSGDIVDSLS